MNHLKNLTFWHLLLAAGVGLAGLSGLWLRRMLRRLDRKLDRLYDQCLSCRREVAARLAGRLEHQLDAAGSREILPLKGRLSRGSRPVARL